MIQDLVSLLLRKETDLPVPPAQPMPAGLQKDKKKKGPEKSMTEYVLDNTPLKSMGFKEASPAIESRAKLDRRRDDEETISQGHRIKSLTKSAESLLNAATRLNEEVEKETKYWEQILSIRERGWSITRMPREKHNLAVRFGFSDATGEFRSRGLAALRAGETGDIILDEALTSAAKSIRVRVLDRGNVVGSSHLLRMDVGQDVFIENLIRAARDSLFDEELFQELTRESRLLLPYNVTMDQDEIRIPYHQSDAEGQSSFESGREVRIDLVRRDDFSTMEEHIHDAEAHGIALVLRLLLSYTHRQRLRQRSQIPPPVADRRREEPTPPILRVLMAYLQQKTTLDIVFRRLDEKVSSLKWEGSHMSYSARSTSPDLGECLARNKETLADQSNTQLSSTFEDLIGNLCAPLETKITLSMDRGTSKSDVAVILLRTHFSSPLFGTRFTLQTLIASPKSATTPETELCDSSDDLIVALEPLIVRGPVQTR